MGQLTPNRVSRPPPVQPDQQKDHHATVDHPNQAIEHIEEDRESTENIEASVSMAQIQQQTSRLSLLSPSNRVNIMDTVEPTSKQARLTSPDISPDQSVARKNHQQRRGSNRVASDDDINTTVHEHGSLRQDTNHQLENAKEGVVQHPVGYEVIEPGNLSVRDNGSQSIHQANSQSPSVKGEPGHILQITLHNFMCHEHFTVTLGPRINFIIGPNGSGKSAILSAIILGLGARATSTNRASSFSSFIRTGQNRAKIVIKLCNYLDSKSRADAYLPEKYGNSITIERLIYASGAGNYKIKNSSGKVISDKKEELDNITKHFQILVDNPVCVLTQEVSKNFLNSKNPKDKFSFFVKATQLEDVRRDYENAYLNRDNSLKGLSEKNETIQVYQKKLKESEKQVKVIEILQNGVQKMENLSFELLWAEVRDEEKAVNKLTQEFEDADKKCRRFWEKIEHATRAKEEFEQKKQESVEHLQNLSATVKACKQDLVSTTEEANEAERNLSSKARKTARCKAALEEYQMNIVTLEKRIRGIERKNRETAGTNFEIQIEEASRQIQELTAQQVTFQEKLKQLNGELDEYQSKRSSFEEEYRRFEARAKSSKTEMERLGTIQKNRLARYSPGDYGQIMKSIEEATRSDKFHRRPFGPIGEYIRLEDMSMALAVEALLKRNLGAFIVDNFDDSKVLHSIFSNVIGSNEAEHPIVMIRKYAPMHPISGHEAVLKGYQNFFQLLNIKEPEVANCLIDHYSIEKILYIPNSKVARDLLLSRETVPRNCIKAYTVDGDVMFPANDRGDFKWYPNKGPKVPRVIVHDCKSALEHHRTNFDACSREASSAKEALNEMQKLSMAKKREIVETESAMASVNEDISQLERKLETLKERANVNPIEVIALKEEIHKFSQDRDTEQEKLDELRAERGQLREVFAAIDKIRSEKAAKYHEMIETRGPTKKKIEQFEHEIASQDRLLMKFNKNQEEMRAKRDHLEEQLAEKQQQIELAREQALANTPEEIESPRSYSEVMADLNRIRLIISENRHMAEDPEQIVNEFKRLQALVGRLVEEMADINGYIDLLSKSISERKNVYHSLRFYISRVVNYFFRNVLAQKEFTGSITPYFQDMTDDEGNVKKAKTLEVLICPRNKEQFASQGSSQNGIYSDTKSLSGGERSFSTVAFIIALWQICPSPFRLLDEVDVFMDMVTRKISIDTLIWFATERSTKQFIFLSPLRMQQIERPECVTINYMPEPVRN